MKQLKTGATAIAATATALAGTGWLGLQVKPSRQLPTAGTKRDFGRINVPNTLPKPVKQYFKAIAGDQIPIVHTAIAWGRPYMRKGVFKLPLSFTSYINAGSDYLREIDVTWFGRPLLHVTDSYIDGVAESKIGRKSTQHSAELDQAACLNLWAEALWTPSVFLSDPRVRWEAVDDNAARLFVPFEGSEEQLLVTFDPQTHLIHCISGERYKASAQKRVHWSCQPMAWLPYGGVAIPTKTAICWEDEKQPWTIWELDGILFNEDVGHKLPPARYVSEQPAAARRPKKRLRSRLLHRFNSQIDERKVAA